MNELQNRIQSCVITDDGEVTLAAHFIQAMTEVVGRMISTNGMVWTYSEGVWSKEDPESLMAYIQCFDGLAFTRPNGSPARVKLSHAKVRGIFSSVLVHRETLSPDFFDDAKPGVCFRNGFVSIDEIKGKQRLVLRPHAWEQKATMKIDQDAPKDMVVPRRFIGFLNELFEGDDDAEGKISVIQEFCGAALANIGYRYQKVLLLVGHGANGKSTLAKIIEGCFPPEQVTSTSPSRWSNEYQLALLSNSRINICTELPTAESDVSDIFKAVVAGDRLVCRLPYQAPQHISPRAAHMFSSNYLPSSKDYSEGFFRRFLIIQLNRNFQKEGVSKTMDSILEQMKEEKAEIIMWCLHGALNLIRRGHYEVPMSGKVAEADWRVEADSVLDFIVSCCNRQDTRDDFEYLSTVYSDFAKWCYSINRKPPGHRVFARRLVALDVAKEKIGGQTKVGLTLKPRAMWADWDLN
jgi:putative DNA primase/helicase